MRLIAHYLRYYCYKQKDCRKCGKYPCAKSVFRKKITMRFKETEYSRKLDTCGRLVIPSKLREAMRLEVGENYPFFTTVDEEGQSWLCIPCPGAETEIDKAKRLLKEAGITSLD